MKEILYAVKGTLLDTTQVRDIAPQVIDVFGRLRVMPAEFWASTTREERAVFGVRHGLYSFPTLELVDRLRELIDGRSAIEIGAGHGVLAQALDIPATDSRQQEQPKYAAVYERLGQATVPYGSNIEWMGAAAAVRKHRPQVVIGCWVTHLYDPARHTAGGNEVGVDEEDILANCETYIHVGNETVHAGKKIWGRPHQVEYPDFVYSRASNGSRDFIASWDGAGRRTGC